MQFSFQRLRNLTTDILHTNNEDVENDLGEILGIGDALPHFMVAKMIPSIRDFLAKNLLDKRFWDNKHDIHHIGMITISKPTDSELGKIWAFYNEE